MAAMLHDVIVTSMTSSSFRGGTRTGDDQIVLPTLAKLLGDPQAEVRQAAGESLVGVANLMKPIDLGHHVLTIVLQLAHDDEQVLQQ